ncbi:MAG: DUF2971 domain-containing protein [Fluviibacter sp.]
MGNGINLRNGSHYKYKSLATSPIDHVIEILRDNKIYFPRLSELNDKEEGKPQLVVGNISDPSYRPNLEAWFRRCVSDRNQTAPNEQQIQAELSQMSQEKLEAMVVRVDEAYKLAIEERFRILSFGCSPFNRHLWNEYSSAFNGVCIEFNTDSHFGTVYKVSYSDAPRHLDLTGKDDFEHLRITVLAKSLHWKDENEARMILGDPPVDGEQPILVNQYYEFPADRLTGLFIGHKVSSSQQEKLLALARLRPNPVRCYKVWPVPWGNRVFFKKIS